MPLVQYPATLPGPSEWELQPTERRAPRGVRQPSDAHRTLARDYHALVRAAWAYSPAEMATWRAWYETTLRLGQLRFNAATPGPGGIVSRVLRYVGPVRRELLGQGIWRVSATVEARGAGLPVQITDALPVLGWNDDALDIGGVPTLGASGGYDMWTNPSTDLHGGLVGSSASATWTLVWTPSGTGSAPVLSQNDPTSGRFRITVASPQFAGGATGTGTITATVAGEPSDNALEFQVIDDFHGLDLVWSEA